MVPVGHRWRVSIGWRRAALIGVIPGIPTGTATGSGSGQAARAVRQRKIHGTKDITGAVCVGLFWR